MMLKARAENRKNERSVPKSVLLLDDHTDRLHALRSALAGAGYAVETASETQEALAKLRSRLPDLIVADLQLPGPDVLPLAEFLLLEPEFAEVPLVALTAESAAAARSPEGLFDGYVADPAQPATLLTQIQSALAAPAERETRETAGRPVPNHADAEEILQQIEAGLPGSQFAPATLASLQSLATSAASQDLAQLPEYLRLAARLTGARTVRGRSAFRALIRLCREIAGRPPDPASGFDELREGYLEKRSLELEALANAVWRSDFPALAKAGHNLKGTGAAYGFSELTDLGRELEHAAKASDALGVEVALEKTGLYLHLVGKFPEQG